MQQFKTLATDLWDEGEKMHKQDPTAVVVFRAVENNANVKILNTIEIKMSKFE
jgi:hypothetical protein